ncbi:hypothetical protein C8D87_11419 [Lentzea atacamensis]|uniref:Uncharacterized protein n=1 Tax=Lentzea atacamensis TaxID=531938 RepID=A0ABX9DWC5_9PSEU|nr:hypothetical protein [Lentzea atacamensis]RAS59407.1 hypothetical protein C8D87_11419 [Lentzea atacamensis]
MISGEGATTFARQLEQWQANPVTAQLKATILMATWSCGETRCGPVASCVATD